MPARREGTLGGVTPRQAAAALLLFDRVLDEYARELGQPLHPLDQRIILSLLRAVARRDSLPSAEPI